VSYGEGITKQRSIKGDYAEDIVTSSFRSLGFELFPPSGENAHLLDGFGLALKNSEIKFFGYDVKSKQARNKYKDSGCDVKHFNHYRNIAESLNQTFLLIFVDEEVGKAYYQILNDYFDVSGTTKQFIAKDGAVYPKTGYKGDEEFIYFSLESMHLLKNLTPKEITDLKEYSKGTNKHYIFDPEWDINNINFNNNNNNDRATD
jgi:hypothetical protein